jgi:shikimate kinase
MNQPIVIIGFMGSGKTTVARALARQLEATMVDLDEMVATREGQTPKQIIEAKGEEEFRKIETNMLVEVLNNQNPRVIAAGGGVWSWTRIAAGGETRPLASTENVARELFTKRLATYELADLRIPVTPGSGAEEIAQQIVRVISSDPTHG